MFETNRIVGVAHRRHDSVYTVRGLSPADVSSALARRGVPVGSIIRDDDRVRFTSPGTDTPDVIAALAEAGARVDVRGDLGTVSVVSTVVGNRPEITARILRELAQGGIEPHLVTSTPSRVSCHIPAGAVDQAARLLHDTFELHHEDAGLAGAAALSGRAG